MTQVSCSFGTLPMACPGWAPQLPAPASGIASRELGAAPGSGEPGLYLERNSVPSNIFAALRAHSKESGSKTIGLVWELPGMLCKRFCITRQRVAGPVRLLEKSPHPGISFFPENNLPWAEDILGSGGHRGLASPCTCLTQAPASPSLRHFSGGPPANLESPVFWGSICSPRDEWNQSRQMQFPPPQHSELDE